MAPRAGLDQPAVVDAAAALADRSGLDGVTLAAIAAHLGVRTPTLYHYVGGLPGLQRELALRGSRALAARLGRAVMGRAGAEALVALADAYRAFVKEHPGLYTATQRAAAPTDTELQAAQYDVVEIVLQALSAYHLPEDTALHAVRALRSAIHGFVSLEAAGGFGLPLAVDDSFRYLMEIFLRGLHGAPED